MIYLAYIILPSILASGWNDYDISLLREYRLVRTNADSVMIYNKEAGFVVPPKIKGLGVRKNLVYGVCEKSEMPDPPCVPGYFLLDTQKTTVKIGLTKTEWLSELSKYGILKEPTLKRPSRYWTVVNNFRKVFWLLLACFLVLSLGFTYSWLKNIRKTKKLGTATNKNKKNQK